MDNEATSTEWNQNLNTMKDFNPYEVLGVPKDASEATIVKQHFRLSRKLRPSPTSDLDKKKRYNDFETAFRILRDPDMRNRFDKYGIAGISGNTIKNSELADILLTKTNPLVEVMGVPTVLSIIHMSYPESETLFSKIDKDYESRIAYLVYQYEVALKLYLVGDVKNFATHVFAIRDTCNNVTGGGKALMSFGKALKEAAESRKGNVICNLFKATSSSNCCSVPSELKKRRDAIFQIRNRISNRLVIEAEENPAASEMSQDGAIDQLDAALWALLEEDMKYVASAIVNTVQTNAGASSQTALEGLIMMGKILSFAKGFDTRMVLSRLPTIDAPPPPPPPRS